MKIKISDDDVLTINQDAAPTLAEMLAFKRFTKQSLPEMMRSVQAGGPSDVDAGLTGIAVLVWLARFRRGERLTLEEACDFPMDEEHLLVEEGEVSAQAVPTSPAGPLELEGSGPDSAGHGQVVQPATPGRSRTSKRRSTTGS